jgi:hypothetical protein
MQPPRPPGARAAGRTVVEDRDGLRRVKYAERDCDLSRFNTAGN